jgi:hypothetical protein
MVERRARRRRDGTTCFVWRTRWRDERGVERSKTFDRATDARAFEAKLRTLKRSGALADLDAGTETLAEFVEEWWLVYAGPNLERSTRRGRRPRACTAIRSRRAGRRPPRWSKRCRSVAALGAGERSISCATAPARTAPSSSSPSRTHTGAADGR